jgi:hypothetical protein
MPPSDNELASESIAREEELFLMVREDHGGRQVVTPSGIVRRRWRFQVAAVALVLVSCSAMGFLMGGLGGNAGTPPRAGGDAEKSAAKLFQLWPKDRAPDIVLMLSGETMGYLHPCGCSSPQYGGLERRYNFWSSLVKERRWPVVSVDLGDVAQKSGPQALVKYKYAMLAEQLLQYTAVVIGRNEMALPLIDALSEYSLNNEWPRVLAANLLKKVERYPSGAPGQSMVRASQVVGQEGKPRVGVVGVVAPSIAKRVQDREISFDSIEKAIPEALKEMEAQKPELLVLLFQGSLEEAKAYAEKFPQFQVVLCLSSDPDPPSQAERVGNTSVVWVGQKGRYVGLIGAYRTGKATPPFDLHYQLVKLGPEYETPAGKESSNPVLGLLENYAKEVKTGNYLSRYSKTDHPIQREFKGATYVGSDKCKRCHEEAYAIWKASPHSRAYKTLVKAQRPSLQQFDGECVRCHVTGFEYTGGFGDEKTTPLLRDNGCENCHGPGSLHVKGNVEPKLVALMNPYKTRPNESDEEKKKRINRLDLSCQKCHDQDNDVHWKFDKWKEGKIAH